MRILYLANIRLPTEKAHGAQITKMCEAFAELGHEVTLAVPRRFNTIRTDPFEYYGVRRSFSVRRLFTLDLVRFGAAGFLLQSFSFAFAAALFARMRGDDLVYTRDPGIAWLCGLLGKRAAWEMHVATDSFLARRAARHARKMIVISGGLRDFYAARGVPLQRIVVAHDGVDLREFGSQSKAELRALLGLPTGRRIVAYVGKFTTMGQTKGVEEIVRAVGEAARARPETFLLVVGLNDDERPLAEACVSEAGLRAGDYALVGHMPRARVPAYLQAADVLVMSYPNTPHYARMMSPLKLFEYMGSGTPIVSTDLPSIREVLSDESAVLVAPDDREALAEGIGRVLGDNELGGRLAERARSDVAHYEWRSRAASILGGLGFVGK